MTDEINEIVVQFDQFGQQTNLNAISVSTKRVGFIVMPLISMCK